MFSKNSLIIFAENKVESFNFSRVLSMSLKNSRMVKSNHLNIELLELNSLAGSADFLPTFSIGSSHLDMGNARSSTFSLEGKYVLWNGFLALVKKNRLKQEVALGELEFILYLESLALDVSKLYYSAVLAYFDLDISKEKLKRLEQRLTIAKGQMNSGTMSRANLLQIQAEYDSAQLSVVESKLAFEELVRGLNFLMGRDLMEPLQLDLNMTLAVNLAPLEEYIESALETNSAYQKFLKTQNITTLKSTELLLAGTAPRVSLSMLRYLGPAARDGDITLGLNVTMPIFNGGKYYTYVRGLKVSADKRILDTEQYEESLKKDVTNKYFQLKTYPERLNAALSQVKSEKGNFEYAEQLFSQGAISFVEYRLYHISYQNARRTYFSLLAKRKQEELAFMKLTGTLVVGGMYKDLAVD